MTSPSSLKRKQTALTLFDKEKIIKIVEDQEKIGAKPNLTKIAEQFKTHRTTIGKIIQKKAELKARINNETQSPTSARYRGFKHEEVDESLNLWVRQKTKQDARLNNALLITKATELAKGFGADFVPSDSWINRFKKRHGLVFKKDQGEGQSNDTEAEAHYRETKM